MGSAEKSLNRKYDPLLFHLGGDIFPVRSHWASKKDKILFVEDDGKIYILNFSMEALREAQAAFTGEAARAGLKDEDDVVSMMKEVRCERTGK